jgi:hypothetical protein
MSKRPPGKTKQAPDPGPQTKAERRDAARRERQELVRKAAVRRKRRRLATVLGVIVLVAGVTVGIVLAASGGGGSRTPHKPKALSGLLTTNAPWPPDSGDPLARANAIGLPPVGQETFHHHDLLEIFVHGQGVPVPADIGLTSNGGASMHTHDATGIMHLESDTRFPYTLGDFFDVWGVRLTRSCIGGYCASGANHLVVYVNGNAVGGDPRTIKLGQHMDVVVTFGSASELPNPIPKTYSVNISPSCAGSC